MSRRLGRLLLAALASTLAAGALAQAAVACTPQTNLPDVEDEVMCTICGTLLAESDSPQAEGERALIRKLIAECDSKDQIKDALVAQYGRNVLATPSGHGFDLLAWLVPGIAIALALAAICIVLWRARGRPRGGGTPMREIEPSDSARLEEDMSRYQL
jgi:cytochrome c-type biogenesis protein CcmH